MVLSPGLNIHCGAKICCSGLERYTRHPIWTPLPTFSVSVMWTDDSPIQHHVEVPYHGCVWTTYQCVHCKGMLSRDFSLVSSIILASWCSGACFAGVWLRSKALSPCPLDVRVPSIRYHPREGWCSTCVCCSHTDRQAGRVYI